MRAVARAAVIGFCAAICAPWAAAQYQAGAVADGGAIKGKVIFKGTVPLKTVGSDVTQSMRVFMGPLEYSLVKAVGIGLERNLAWVGRRTEVLIDEVRPPRSHDHDAALATAPRVAGRTRENKLVHLDGDPELVGRMVEVEVEHAGPYALTGRLVETA